MARTSSLAACTAIPLRMVAQRKGWKLAAVNVDARLLKEGDQTHIERTLSLRQHRIKALPVSAGRDN